MNNTVRKLFVGDLVLFYNGHTPIIGYVLSDNDFRVTKLQKPCEDAYFIECRTDDRKHGFIAAACPEICKVLRRIRPKYRKDNSNEF